MAAISVIEACKDLMGGNSIVETALMHFRDGLLDSLPNAGALFQAQAVYLCELLKLLFAVIGRECQLQSFLTCPLSVKFDDEVYAFVLCVALIHADIYILRPESRVAGSAVKPPNASVI